MGNTRSSEHSSIDWLAKEPLASHIDAYMLYLRGSTVRVQKHLFFTPPPQCLCGFPAAFLEMRVMAR